MKFLSHARLIKKIESDFDPWHTLLRQGAAPMSDYQIHYLNRERALACLMITQCESDTAAKDLAASLSGIEHRFFEIWRGDRLVHEGFNPHIAH